MNILFIGQYRQLFDGWNSVGQTTVELLSRTSHNVTIRPIYLGQRTANEIPLKFIELENNVYDKYDMVIQAVLPHLCDYNSAFGKNVCLANFETSKLNYTSWPARLNLMDEVWVHSKREEESLRQSGVNVQIKLVKHAVDLSKFQQRYEPLLPNIVDKFCFYFIGEFIPRKGILDLFTAYLSEFSISDDVILIVKTGGDTKQIQNLIEQLKNSLAMYGNKKLYPHIHVINQLISDEDLLRLHSQCHCFVMPSYGESLCIPAFEAMGFGNTPIVTDKTGMVEYIDNEVGWVIPSEETTVSSTSRPLADLYTAWETWRSPNILKLKSAMKEAYSTDRTIKSKLCQKRITEYSYDKVVKEYQELIIT